MYPRQSPTTYTEQLGDEVAVYDRARAEVHALNPTAARVWRRCDGATSPDAIAAALRQELGIPEAEAVVGLTLEQFALVHLLELPIEPRGEGAAPTRRWLLGRGLTAAMLPAVYSIVAPAPAAAQSVPPPAAPTLTGLSPNSGTAGTTAGVTLTGTNFVVGATTVTVNSGGVTASNVIVGSTTSLTANIVMDPAAVLGAHTVTVTTAGGTSGAQTFTVNPPPPATPTLTSVAPNQGIQGATVAVTLTGTNFVVAATTVNVSGSGVTVNNVVVGSTTSLTASFVLDPAAALGARTVTVTTAGGTSGGQTFTISVPPGSQTFNFTGSPETFTVPGGVVALTIVAVGARGGRGSGDGVLDPLGRGGRTTATVSVVAGASLTLRVGGVGPDGAFSATAGGFNGGGGSTGDGGAGGGASTVHDGATPLVVAGGGGGNGSDSGGSGNLDGGVGGAGGDVTGGPGGTVVSGGGGGGGGTQGAGGIGGIRGNLVSGTDGTAGVSGQGGVGGHHQPDVIGGGGGGGGYFGGGGGGGGSADNAAGGGGGGSSFTAPGATGVVHEQGVNIGAGSVTISW